MINKKILITGGCGFIGHHFVEHIFRKTKWAIFIIDKLSYASNGLERLRDIGILESPRIKIFTTDLINPISEGIAKELGDINYIVHMAAETHIDNSIKHPVDVIRNNVMSTVNILEYARGCKTLERFFYFSTDEVYGCAPDDIAYKETDRHNPTNPYSSSKSAGEQFCVAYENTYKLPIIMVNVMNAFGERQHVEKFIPKCIKYILEDRLIPIHSDTSCTKAGTRFYIHARNIASAVLFLIKNGKIGELYHITGEKEVSNLEMAQFIAGVLGKELKYELVNFHSERPGHDLRYSLDGTKLFSLGWSLPVNFEHSLRNTIKWTLENIKWLEE
jgi:dTDP-glucose 4,6-dehydratase